MMTLPSKTSGRWSSTWVIQDQASTRQIESFYLKGTSNQGSMPFTVTDLDQMMAKTQQITEWLNQFESASGDPISVLCVVEARIPEERHSKPRLVTVYWPGWGGVSRPRVELAALILMKNFQKNPIESPVLNYANLTVSAQEAMESVIPSPALV